eukprot:2185633-Prorocentrum_lima.AAC.1
MTVGQEHPVAHLAAFAEQSHGGGCLALAQRTVVHLHVQLLGQREHVGRGVHAGRQHEHQRRVACGCSVDGPQVEGRRVHEVGPHVGLDKIGGGEEAAVHTQRAKDAHLLQIAALVLPVRRQARLLGRGAQEPRLPV